MTEWESPEFFEWMAEHDEDRYLVERQKKRSQVLREKMNDMSPVQRQAMMLRMTFAPGLTTSSI